MRDVVCLTLYSTTADTRRAVEARFGVDITCLDLFTVRGLGVKRGLGLLRANPCRTLVVPIETVNDESMMPIMAIMAWFVPASKRTYLFGDGRTAAFGLGTQIAASMRILWISIRGLLAVLLNYWQARSLMGKARIAFSARHARDGEGTVAYLYGNYTLGIKAGGSYGHIAGVANSLMDHGYGLEFYFIDDGPLVDGRAERRRIPLPKALAMPQVANMHLANRAEIAMMRPLLSGQRHAFIYQRLSLANFAGAALSRAADVPLVVEYNGSEVWAQIYWGVGLRFRRTCEAMEQAILKHAHVVVTISDPLRDELIGFGIDPKRIVTYPNGIDPKIFDPARFSDADNAALRARLGFAPGDKVALFLGTFGRWHGAEVFAAAIRDVAMDQRDELRRSGLKFLFVGDGMTMPQVREILDNPECVEFVRFTGVVPQREGPAYLAISDICMSPHIPNADGSRFFGSPTKLFEYMAMGKPIVASHLDQIGEVLTPGVPVSEIEKLPPSPAAGEDRLALMTTPGDREDIKRALLFLADSPDWMAVMARNARAKALEKYTWKVHVDEILAGIRQAHAID